MCPLDLASLKWGDDGELSPNDTLNLVERLAKAEEMSQGSDQWVQEQCFKTEFKAFVNARAKSLAFTNVYRVIYQSPGLSGEVVRVAKGKALLNSDDRLVG